MSKQAKKSTKRARQASAKVHIDATGKNMTSQAGLIPVIQFLDKLGFRELFQQTVHHDRRHNAVYTLEDSVFLIVVGLIGGAYSLSKCVFLCASCRVLQRVSGWLRSPDETTLGRVFKEVGELETLVHRMRAKSLATRHAGRDQSDWCPANALDRSGFQCQNSVWQTTRHGKRP